MLRRVALASIFLFAVACGDTSTPRQKDASTDAGTNGGDDSGMNGGHDSGMNGGDDSGTNGGHDSGMNVGDDAGMNVGHDTGMNGGADSGTNDAGMVDAGSPAVCNAVDGTGCPNANLTCVHTAATGPLCVQKAAIPKQLGESCDKTNQDCAAGLSCYNKAGQAPTCTKLCRSGMNIDCQGLGGTYKCGPNLFNQNYGACFEAPAPCVPYDDTCANMQSCQRSTDSATEYVCLAEGTRNVGETCGAEGACKKGGVCMGLNGAASTCMVPCDPSAPQCAGNSACVGIQVNGTLLSFGVCQGFTACSPLTPDDCAMNETCSQVGQTQTGCAPAGTAAAGQACGNTNNCAHGLICLNLIDSMTMQPIGPKCYNPCGGAVECATGTCGQLSGAGFGVCN